jgi:hypothetical protein
MNFGRVRETFLKRFPGFVCFSASHDVSRDRDEECREEHRGDRALHVRKYSCDHWESSLSLRMICSNPQ